MALQLTLNPYSTDVDHNRHSLFLLAPAWPVIKIKYLLNLERMKYGET